MQRRCGTGWVVLLLAAGAPVRVLKPGVVLPPIKPSALHTAYAAAVAQAGRVGKLLAGEGLEANLARAKAGLAKAGAR